MKINPATLDNREVHHLFMTVISPRPIAWVSTVNETGINNLAPFSTYTLLSGIPPVVGFGVGRYRDGKKKDTLVNIEQNGQFVINVVTEDLGEAMNMTSAPYPAEVSEFEKTRLTPVKGELVAAARVGEAMVSLECRLKQILRFGEEPSQNSFIIGDVLLVHVQDKLWNKGTIDSSKLKTIGRMGGTDLYCRTSDWFEMKRPEGVPT
jgi:flavin reductase (DIM6/NTAB) family NADH-FMN oxidoreductase RutF